MPNPPPPRVVRAPERPLLRRLRHLLALAAVALPLVASVAAPAGAPADRPPDVVPVPRVDVAVAPVPDVLDVVPGPGVLPDPVDVVPVADLLDVVPGPRGPGGPSVAPWDALADCESGGRWDAVRTIDGGAAYRGGLQFADATWDAFRPDGFPTRASDASREQQIVVAERVLAVQGWGAWPACSRRLGLR